MEYPMPRGARLPLTPHLLELRELAGRSFVTLGNLDECPSAQETALLADVLIALVEMHGAWSGGRATVEVLATVPCHLATTAPLVQYEQGSSSGRAGLVRVTDRTELAACLSKSWATIRPLVLCAHDASRIRAEDLEQLEGPQETPRGTLAEAASLLALRWFHPVQVDFYSSAFAPAAVADVVRAVYAERGALIEQVFEHF